MIRIKEHLEFSEGDDVVLAEGTYQGTVGTFLRLRKDVNWADIRERNGCIRSHPVAWLTLLPGSTRRRDQATTTLFERIEPPAQLGTGRNK